MPRLEPREQGDEDYLCGVYSVINGCLRLVPDLTEDQITALFRSLCQTLEQDGRLLEALTHGGGHAMVGSLLDAACSNLNGPDRTLVKEPRQLAQEYPWDALSDLAAQTDVSVLITFAGPVGGHWSVVERVGRRKLHLFDSNGYGSLKLGKCGFSREAEYRLSRRVFILRRA